AQVRTVDALVDLYFASVGRNAKLLLNVPPTREGRLHETDVARLRGMHERLQALFAHDLALGRSLGWQSTGPRSAEGEVDLGRAVSLEIADLGEDVSRGQRVSRYVLEGGADGRWSVLARGTTIGYRKLDRFAPPAVRRVRLRIEDAAEAPGPVRLALYGPGPSAGPS